MNICAQKLTECLQLHKTARRAPRRAVEKKIPLAIGAGGAAIRRVGREYARVRAVYATRQNAPDYAPQARVIGQGSRGLPCSPPLFFTSPRWGRVVVVRPCATNRGRLLAVAKLDGVSDFPNCRSRGGQPLLRG